MTKEQILKDINKEYLSKTLKVEPLDNLQCMNTDTMKLLQAFIGKDPMSPFYGKIIGFFSYKNQYYRFHWHVHRPNQKNPHLSNHMTDLHYLKIRPAFGDEEFFTYEDSWMGKEAFWVNTSLQQCKDYSQDAYELRKLMNNIKTYSQSQNFCKMFRKTDQLALTHNPIFQ